jgi:hypothetical protein
VRWDRYKPLVEQWEKHPPAHPENPRYIGYEIRVDGQYSMIESIINIFRARGWLDPPPAPYKWAVLTVYYRAPADAWERFAAL